MKVLRNQTAVDNASSLFRIIEKRRELEGQEKELKEFFKGQLGGEDGVIKAGDYLVTVETKPRTDLDRKALKDHLGPRFDDFTKQSPYQTLQIRMA